MCLCARSIRAYAIVVRQSPPTLWGEVCLLTAWPWEMFANKWGEHCIFMKCVYKKYTKTGNVSAAAWRNVGGLKMGSWWRQTHQCLSVCTSSPFTSSLLEGASAPRGEGCGRKKLQMLSQGFLHALPLVALWSLEGATQLVLCISHTRAELPDCESAGSSRAAPQTSACATRSMVDSRERSRGQKTITMESSDTLARGPRVTNTRQILFFGGGR